MQSIETHVNMTAIKGGKGNSIIASFNDIQDKLDTLIYIINQTGVSAKEAGDALKRLSQALAGPATPEATETPNENSHFDFLEQNAYNEAESIFNGEQFGQIIPLDIPKNL